MIRLGRICAFSWPHINRLFQINITSFVVIRFVTKIYIVRIQPDFCINVLPHEYEWDGNNVWFPFSFANSLTFIDFIVLTNYTFYEHILTHCLFKIICPCTLCNESNLFHLRAISNGIEGLIDTIQNLYIGVHCWN